MKKSRNKGTSTVFGSILFIILALTLSSILFLTLYKYNYSIQEAMRLEEERMQEKIVLSRLVTQNMSGTEYITAIFINNTGSITARIRALYIDHKFISDLSDNAINPNDTYINPKETLWVLLPAGTEYEAKAKMTIATERGIRSTEYEERLKQGGGNPSSTEQTKFYFGPLMLDFNKFYYTMCDPKTGSYDPLTWEPGWSIEVGTGTIVWNITVKNVDDRNITINQFSCLTLVPNDEPSERRPWYIEPAGGALTQFIAVNDTVNIIYIWSTPKMKATSPQSIYTTICRTRVFLTFFGVFHEHDGTTKPYGQTIPFEAVLCVKSGGTIQISASPSIILANSTMSSTITAKVYNRFGNPVANANVTFSTNLGTLSKLWAITDSNGTAIVTLYPSTWPGIANVTATWGGISQSTTVIFNGVPVASFTESADIVYTNEVISFNASDSYDLDGYIASYVWDFGDGTKATGLTTNHTYTENGVYTVTLKVTDDRGATDSASATKKVLNRPPEAAFTESAEIVYTGEIIHFNGSTSYDPDGSITGYSWTFGDGTITTGNLVDHAYADDGTYTVTLTVTDNDGAKTTATATKTVLNRVPVASFTESAITAFTGQVIYFNASTSYDYDGTILTYFWDFGDTTNATGTLVSHTYIENGTYVVSLTVTDDDGATASTSSIETILNRPPVATFSESAEAVYSGEAITFNASASYDPDGVIVRYFWTFGDGTNATGIIVDHAYADNGDYTVTLTITDNDGAMADISATKTVRNRPPTASFTESTATAFTNDIIYFNASGSYDSDGLIVSYFWDFGDGTNATGVTTSHAYVENGDYMVKLTITDNDGASSTASSLKTILNRAPVASFTESATSVLTGEIINFNASTSYDPDGSIVNYFWTFGDGINATGIAVDHAYSDESVYTVVLTVTDNDGATATAPATKTVLNRPPVAIFTESAETVYVGETIAFNASGSYDPDGTIASFFWDYGDGTNATGISASHAYSNDGVYTVTLTVKDDDGASTSSNATKTVLNRPPVASFTESAETVYTGETITLNGSSSYDLDGMIISYFWDFGDGTNATSIVISHAYIDDGTYFVSLTITDNDGATTTATVTKKVLNRPPTASFSESAETVLTGEVIYFDASASGDPDGVIISYLWTFGDGSIATGLTANHAYADDGIYAVTLTVTDNDGTTGIVAGTMTVLNRPPIALFTENATTVLTGVAIRFNASDSYDPDGTLVYFFWNFGDGTNATGIVADHTYADNGTYTVALTVTDDDSATCTETSIKTILNKPPVAFFTESGETVYTGEIITFNATGSYDFDGAIVSYYWNFGDGTNATGIALGHSYADNGNYTVTLTVTDDDSATASATTTKTVLNRPPVASFTESTTTAYTGEVITFNASASYDLDGSILSYFWDFGDGTNATGIVVDHSYVNEGTYTVILTVIDDDGATISVNVTITVLLNKEGG